MTKIYNYHPDTGAYLSQSTADPDPLNPGRYLIPAFSTIQPPPIAEDDQRVVFDGQSWQIVSIPVEVPAPAPEISPADKHQALLVAVAAQRLAVETGGLVLPNGVRVGTDREDQAIITGAVSAVQLGIKEYDWKGTDNVWIKLSAAEITQIGAAVAMHVQACFTAERRHCEAIAVTPDDELGDYDINAGWPG